LVWTVHHLITDGWSSAELLSEVFRQYEGVLQGKPAEGKGAEQYGQYVEWLERRERGSWEAYWRKELSGFEGATLVTKSLSPGQRGEGYGERRVQLSGERSEAVRRYAREQRVTVNTLLQGALALLLSRYTSQSDVVMGVTTSGRSGGERAGALGVYINTLPLRVKVEGVREVGEWLRELQERNAEMREHEHAPLFEVQRYAKAVLSEGGGLFDTLLVFENYPVEEALRSSARQLGVLRVESRERTNYPVTFVVVAGERVTVRLWYERSQLGEEDARQLMEHLEQGLLELLKSERLRDVSLLSEGERERLLREWNETRAEYPRERCVHELIEERVSETPDAVAVAFGGEQLSYGELNGRANQLARKLRSDGVGADERVGLFVERSLELMVGVLGILKAGGAYVPLEPEYPAERLKWMLEDSAPRLVLTQKRLLEQVPRVAAAKWCLDEDWAEVSELSAGNVETSTLSQNLAYVIYTSGSTGRPKGVACHHRGLVNRIWWMQRAYDIGAADGVAHKTPLGFDVSVWELFWPLAVGSRLTVMAPGAHRDPRQLAESVEREGVTVMHFVPSMLEGFVRAGELSRARTLKTLICSGEALGYGLAKEASEEGTARVHNLYGPTESSIDVTSWCFEEEGNRSVPIGHAISNVQLHVLDGELGPVPLGVVGELYIGGEGLARGYINREDLTSERFVPNPCGGWGERLYRTGDLGRRRADGALEYVGRADQQVKIRGYRIELGEIEARLLEHGGVSEAVVQVRGAAAEERRLVAYVVAKERGSEEQSLVASVREHAAATLPGYMVPAQWLVLDELPLTSNGKVDRNALPELDGAVLQRQYEAPQTAFERRLAEIWQEVLRVERVGRRDNFFELGGDSILALQVASRARETGVRIGPQDIFRTPSLAGLATAVESALVPPQAELQSLWMDLNDLTGAK
jgi:amino acid adenylation domain-containing protein